ncbi:hypothetical protein [Paraburkholderia caffeinilytica]|uniref:hypothetical protein n=1 Tax=Paraburkholderia caffeinilytica TaxID=1761016 RepID=UPI000E20F690|nr:hypothetical protein [Paraburkholderia caffeinilytica]CAB3791410.1 hypothetical protein LMG28690_03272 [Paraburkholderia caffeinilytica]
MTLLGPDFIHPDKLRMSVRHGDEAAAASSHEIVASFNCYVYPGRKPDAAVSEFNALTGPAG